MSFSRDEIAAFRRTLSRALFFAHDENLRVAGGSRQPPRQVFTYPDPPAEKHGPALTLRRLMRTIDALEAQDILLFVSGLGTVHAVGGHRSVPLKTRRLLRARCAEVVAILKAREARPPRPAEAADASDDEEGE